MKTWSSSRPQWGLGAPKSSRTHLKDPIEPLRLRKGPSRFNQQVQDPSEPQKTPMTAPNNTAPSPSHNPPKTATHLQPQYARKPKIPIPEKLLLCTPRSPEKTTHPKVPKPGPYPPRVNIHRSDEGTQEVGAVANKPQHPSVSMVGTQIIDK